MKYLAMAALLFLPSRVGPSLNPFHGVAPRYQWNGNNPLLVHEPFYVVQFPNYPVYDEDRQMIWGLV